MLLGYKVIVAIDVHFEVMAYNKKHSKTEHDEVLKDSSGHNSSDDNEDNYLEFVADGSVHVSELQSQAMQVNEGLAKLKISAVVEILEWVNAGDLYHQ